MKGSATKSLSFMMKILGGPRKKAKPKRMCNEGNDGKSWEYYVWAIQHAQVTFIDTI